MRCGAARAVHAAKGGDTRSKLEKKHNTPVLLDHRGLGDMCPSHAKPSRQPSVPSLRRYELDDMTGLASDAHDELLHWTNQEPLCKDTGEAQAFGWPRPPRPVLGLPWPIMSRKAIGDICRTPQERVDALLHWGLS
jgi:hypothetical protein